MPYIFQGATIKTDEETGKIIIARIMHGGAADRSGLIHVGDEVIEVNGINVEGKTPNDVLTILVSKNDRAINCFFFCSVVWFDVFLFGKSKIFMMDSFCDVSAKFRGNHYVQIGTIRWKKRATRE